MHNKKLVILISSLVQGGAERRASSLGNDLAEKGYRVDLITLDSGVNFSISGKVNYHQVSALDAHANKLVKLFYTPYQVIKLRKLIKEINPDIVLSFLERPNLLNVLLKNNLKYKSIASVRSFPSISYKKGFHGFIFKKFLRHIAKKADKIIANSEQTVKDLVENFNSDPEKTVVIYNPYDIEEIKNLTKEAVNHPWFQENVPIVISSGRLVEQKGQWHLIRAFSEIRKKTKARLIILGDGKLEEYLKKLARELAIENEVAFLGWKKNPFKYIAKSSVFAFPSLYEGFPNALVEAMICGVSVISSDCFSGPREILGDDEYGILFPVCDGKLYGAKDPLTKEENTLALGISKLLENKELREEYKIKALERVKDFSKERIIPEYEKHLFN